MFRYSLYAALLLVATTPSALAQVQPEMFSYPVGLNSNGDNFLALHSVPSASDGTRIAKLGPDTLFTELERSGGWVHVRLLSGDTGWVSANYVGCCRAAVGEEQDFDSSSRGSGIVLRSTLVSAQCDLQGGGILLSHTKSDLSFWECRLPVRQRSGCASIGPAT